MSDDFLPGSNMDMKTGQLLAEKMDQRGKGLAISLAVWSGLSVLNMAYESALNGSVYSWEYMDFLSHSILHVGTWMICALNVMSQTLFYGEEGGWLWDMHRFGDYSHCLWWL